MLKKLSFALLILTATVSRAQNKELLKVIDEKIANNDGITGFQTSDFSFDYVKDEDLDKNSMVYADRKKFNPNFFDKIPVRIKTSFPNTVAKLLFNENDLTAMLGGDVYYFRDFPEKKPIIIPRTIHYINGTSEDAKNIFISDEEIHGNKFDTFLLKTVKPIKSITFDISANFGNTKSYFINKGDREVKVGNSVISVEKFAENYVKLVIPKELDKKILIQGIHKNGKYLSEKGNYSKNYNIENEQLEQSLATYITAKEKVQKNEILTEKELDSFLRKNLPEIKKRANANAEVLTKYYTALVDKIEIIFTEDAPKTTVQKTLNTPETYQEKFINQPFTYCEDSESGKFGIVDLDGKWFIPPAFHKISQHNFVPYHFQVAATEKDNLNDHWFWLDTASKKLTEVNYKPDLWNRKNNGELIIINDPVTKKEGLLRTKDGKLLIPNEYYDLAFEEDGLLEATIQAGKDKKTGIITTENKVVVPIEFVNVKRIGSLFVGDRDLMPEKLYDSQGKLISQEYFLIGSEFSEGLLRAETKKEITKAECDKSDFCAMSSANGLKKYYEVQQFHFLNEKGESRFHIERSQYKSVGNFHNGLALVENLDEKFGYIDTNGKIKIAPQFDYSVGMDFYGKYAVVEIGNESWLIDQNGNKVFKLPDSAYSADNKKIRLYNGTEYNYDGEVIKSK